MLLTHVELTSEEIGVKIFEGHEVLSPFGPHGPLEIVHLSALKADLT
jgi:hypothetical protein